MIDFVTLQEKRLKLTIYLVFALLFCSVASSQQHSKVIQDNSYQAVDGIYHSYFQNIEQKKGTGWKPYLRWQAFWRDRLSNTDELPGTMALYLNYAGAKSKYDKSQFGSQWVELGPKTVPENLLAYKSSGIGRMNCIRVHPYMKNVLFAGAASGGLWKSTDSGKTWKVMTATQFMSLGITDIAISPSNPNVIYAATGDANGLHMTRGYSIGIIKSTDGGETWQLAGDDHELSENLITGRILVNPNDDKIAIAATYQGIIKTTDGGNTWINKKQGFFFRDMEHKPGDFNVLYVSTFSMDGTTYIFKSEDAGETWMLSQSFNNVNRIALAVSKAKPERVYALCSKSADNGFAGFYISENEGNQWSKKSGEPNILSIAKDGKEIGGQGYYDLALAVSPENPDFIISAGIHLWKSTDAGRNWSLMNHWAGADNIPYMHADQHDVIFSNDLTIYSANDGGVYNSLDTGKTWNDISNGISVMQIYRIGAYSGADHPVFCGVQDNGTNYFDGKKWYHPNGSDGTECIVNYSDPSKVYSSLINGDLYFSSDSGKSFNKMVMGAQFGENGSWVTPFAMNPLNPDCIFAAYNNVWKSYNNGKDWERYSNFGETESIGAMAVAPSDTNIVYVSFGGRLMGTAMNNSGWQIIGMFAEVITYIAVDPADPEHLYVSLSGYNKDNKVMEIIHGKIVNISAGLPNVPVNCIIYQKDSPHRIFIGTDIGVYYHDAMTSGWEKLEDDLPSVVVNELEINHFNNKLLAGTFGRGLWVYQLPDCQVTKPVLNVQNDTVICKDMSITLQTTKQYKSYKWSDGSTGSKLVVKDSGYYYLTVGDGSGCYNSSKIIRVDVEDGTNTKLLYSVDGNLCAGDSVRLEAPEGYSNYKWLSGETSRIIYAKVSGNYFAILYTNDGCVFFTDTVNLIFKPTPEKPEITRQGNTLISSDADYYNWYLDDNLLAGETEKELKITKLGKYKVEVFNSDSCSAFSDEYPITSDVSWGDETIPDIEKMLKSPMDYGIERAVISDCLGRIISDINTESGISIDKSKFNNGLYFVRFFIGRETMTAKIVVY